LYKGAGDIARAFNTYINPATPFVELATGKSVESDFTQDKSRMTSAGEALMVALPLVKAEGSLAKITEKTMSSGEEKAATTTAAQTQSNTAPNFIVDGKGTAYPVPKGATGPEVADNGKGIKYTGGSGGTNGQVTTMRIMDPVSAKGNAPAYPNGYIKYTNSQGQGVNPYSGQTGSNAATHYPINGNPKIIPIVTPHN
jgi:hypothetical protein